MLAPCIVDLPATLVAELAILPIHNANAALLRALPEKQRPHAPDFAGICLTDPFVRLDFLFERLLRVGIRGVANFPTVSVLMTVNEDAQLTRLRRRELLGLDRAREAGLEVLRIGPEGEPGSIDARALAVASN